MSSSDSSVAYSDSTMATASSKRLVRWRMVLGRWMGIALGTQAPAREDDHCWHNNHSWRVATGICRRPKWFIVGRVRDRRCKRRRLMDAGEGRHELGGPVGGSDAHAARGGEADGRSPR